VVLGEVQAVIRTQQNAIYDAERNVRKGRRFTTEQEAQEWVDGLRETWWWQRFFWKAPARTEVYWRARGSESVGSESVGSYDAANDAGVVEMLPSHRNELIILHELSHVIAAAMNDSKAHDPFFARTYVNLVYLALGGDAYLELQRAFEEHGIDYMQAVKE
jgi:putative metallohydrolase (TIGR04338 family)